MSNSIASATFERAKLDFERASFNAFVPRFATFDGTMLNEAIAANPSGSALASGLGSLLSKKNLRNFIIQGERLNLFLYILPPSLRAQHLVDSPGSISAAPLDADVFQHLKVTVQPKIKGRFYQPNDSSASLPAPYASFPAAIFEKSPFSSHDSLQNFSRPNYTDLAPPPLAPSSSSASSPASSSSADAEPAPSPPISNCFAQRSTATIKPEMLLANGGLLYRVEIPISFTIQEATCSVSFFITIEPVQHLLSPFGIQAAFMQSLDRPMSLHEEMASLHPEGGLLRSDPLLKKTKLSLMLLQPLQISVHTLQSFGKQLITVQLENTFQRDQIVIHDLNLQLAETFFISLKSNLLRKPVAANPASPLPRRVLSSDPLARSISPLSGSFDPEIFTEVTPGSFTALSSIASLISDENLPIGDVLPVQIDSLFLFSTQKPSLPLVLLPGDQFHFVVTLDPLPTYNLSVGAGFFKSNMLVSWTTPAAYDLLNCRRDVYWANPFHGNQYLLHVFSQKQHSHPVGTPFVVDFLISNMSDTPCQLSLTFETPSVDTQPLIPLQPHTNLGTVPALSSVSLQVPFVGLERGVHEITGIKLYDHKTGLSSELIHPIVFLIDDVLNSY